MDVGTQALETLSGVILFKNALVTLSVLFIVSCASKDLMDYDKSAEFELNEEYDKVVKVKTIEQPKPPISTVKAAPPKKPIVEKKEQKKKLVQPKKTPIASPAKTKKKAPRQPTLEDSEGFIGRRPQVDPYRVGEKVVLDVTYFNMKAGTMTLETLPFVEVNGQKSYHFKVSIKSSKVFEYFYAVDDTAETYVDYETLRPSSYSINVKESKQLKDIRSYFDWQNLKAHYWEKKVTKSKGEQKKKKSWKIKEYSQNVISVLFYLRNFQLRENKDFAIRIADEGKNMIFTGKVVRKEVIDSPEGKIKTVVVKPKIEIDGAFKQVGDIFIWLTDDDRKLPVRIESKIKIGTLICRLKELRY